MQQILTIDMGNTRTKVGLFGDGALQWVKTLLTAELPRYWPDLLTQIDSKALLKVGWMSVARPIELQELSGWEHFFTRPSIRFISSQDELPIVNLYATPQTLGTDRIIAVIGGLALAGKGPILVIDAGTALTYEVANEKGAYLGGGIAPGIQMRFRALQEFTARLPLIKMTDNPPVTGDSTEHSIQSGVLQGILAEVQGRIDQYRSIYGEDLSVILTGGDAPFFENHLKNLNFADANLNLRGIYHILTV